MLIIPRNSGERKNHFKELVEQENNNHKDYENTLTKNEAMDQIRIDRFHYEFISSQHQQKENGEVKENDYDDEHWGIPLFNE